jgi:hypothetical protein
MRPVTKTATSAWPSSVNSESARPVGPSPSLRAYDWTLTRTVALLAQLHAQGGDLATAIATLQQGLESARLNGDRPSLGVCLARAIVVLAAAGEDDTAALLWGAIADGVYARVTVLPPNEISGHSQLMAALRSRLGDARYTAASSSGAATTYEQVTTFTMAAVKKLFSDGASSPSRQSLDS